MTEPKPKRPRLPTGHRQLVNLLLKGGLIQLDESGLAWVSASRSHGHFSRAVVERIKVRGFTGRDDIEGRRRFVLEESKYPGKWWSVLDPNPPPKRERKKKAKTA